MPTTTAENPRPDAEPTPLGGAPTETVAHPPGAQYPSVRARTAGMPKELARGLNSVGLSLLQAAAKRDSGATSVWVSPYSIGAALMTLAPLLADAAVAEIVSTLGMGSASSMTIVQAFKELSLSFSPSRDDDGMITGAVKYLLGCCAAPPVADSPIVVTANSIWLRDDFRATPACGAILADSGNTELNSFSARTLDGSTINAWVRERTSGMISSVVPSTLPSDYVFALVNALYFKAAWKLAFDPSATRPYPFYTSGGKPILEFVPMMRMHRELECAHLKEIGKAVRLPYKRDGDILTNQRAAFAATFVLPNPGKSPEDALSVIQAMGGFKAAVASGLSSRRAELSLPRFHAECSQSLEAELRRLGITKAFSPTASGLSSSVLGPAVPSFGLSHVVQSVKIRVDEEKTEAAGITMVEISKGCTTPTHDFKMEFDRPFIMVVEELKSGVIAFVGIVRIPELPV